MDGSSRRQGTDVQEISSPDAAAVLIYSLPFQNFLPILLSLRSLFPLSSLFSLLSRVDSRLFGPSSTSRGLFLCFSILSFLLTFASQITLFDRVHTSFSLGGTSALFFLSKLTFSRLTYFLTQWLLSSLPSLALLPSSLAWLLLFPWTIP